MAWVYIVSDRFFVPFYYVCSPRLVLAVNASAPCFGHVFIVPAQEMLLSIVDNSGPGFRSSEKFILAVRHYLCDALLLNSTSSNRTVMKLSLKIFKPMCRDFKVCLTDWLIRIV